MEAPAKKPRGFAAMSPELQRKIASMGGKAAHVAGTAHEFTPDEARAAGKKGGDTISQNREFMAEIGRKGGSVSRRGPANKTSTTVVAPSGT